MIPKRIELENFLSFGSPAVSLTFTEDEPLWVLCGRNGVGKSAVFDGITYALYGEHRGGSQKFDQLVRHGASSFRVVLEFEFAGVDYRITRGRSGRPIHKVEERRNECWVALLGVNSATDVKRWVIEKLGLTFNAFTTSVLLRQGEADKLFSASRDDRLAVLKRIIGFEHYEELSERVHQATHRHASTLELLRSQWNACAPVLPGELATAEAALTAATETRYEAQSTFTEAAQRVEQARQWEGLVARHGEILRRLEEARGRAARADSIHTTWSRLDDLTTAVPQLESLVGLRSTITDLEPALAAAELARDEAAAHLERTAHASRQARQKEAHHKEQGRELARQARALRENIARTNGILHIADAMRAVKCRLEAYPEDLADLVSRAESDEKAAREATQQKSDNLAARNALYLQILEQQGRFADVTVGVACSLCGQLVDEAHAAKERIRLAREVKSRKAELARLRAASKAAEAAEIAACQRRLTFQNDRSEYDGNLARFLAMQASLAQLGQVSDPGTIRGCLEEQESAMSRAEWGAANEAELQTEAAGDVDRLDHEYNQFDLEFRKATDAVRLLELELAASRTEYQAGWARLASVWQERIRYLSEEDVRALSQERDQLQASGVAAQFDRLRQDVEKGAEWSEQLHILETGMGCIPGDARIPVPAAEALLVEAKYQWGHANASRDQALRICDDLRSRSEQCQTLATRLRATERAHLLHKKLDRLLGQTGLQRSLVRDAEQLIVELANETLHHLSDGTLSLEQDHEALGRDARAFALRVRRMGDRHPIGVQFLSGSQKFRVAVSIAIAIGRFASGRARPLEAVIIDEGFGSLDKDGLRAMSDELKRLQQSQSLARVILVSHQEEFTDLFPVGYRLSAGPNGTVAIPFRR